MCKQCIPKKKCDTKVSFHNHTDSSNIRLLDSINRIEDLVDTAIELNYKGIGITEHEFLGSHHKAIKYVEEGKKIDEKTGKSKIPQDFKLILGNEIYLVEDAQWCQDNYYNKEVQVKFYHYLLLAKNAEGHKALRKLSSKAWENSFRTGLMERVPTEEHYLEQVVKEHPNTLIATSACMGGRIPHEIMKAHAHINVAKKIETGMDLPTVSDNQRMADIKAKNSLTNYHSNGKDVTDKLEKFTPQYSWEENKEIENGWNSTAQDHYKLAEEAMKRAEEYIEWNISLFGKDDFYLELQPATYDDQIIVNKQLVKLADKYDLQLIITSDAHYARPEDAMIHEAFLNAKEGDREVADFYGHTYLHSIPEIYEKMNYLDEGVISSALYSTLHLSDKIEEYTLEQETIIPRIKLPEFNVQHIFKKWYNQYEYIEKMANSKEEQDRYLIYLIENGFLELIPYTTMEEERFHVYLNRIDLEVGELWKLSEKMNQAVSSYYVTTARLVDIIWGDDECSGSFESGSLVGFGRGSAVAFLINYLMKITMVNPLEYGIEIPHWRHLSSGMSDISALDIDIDINAIKRQHIFKRLREEFGENNFLQVSTFGTEASKSAIKTSCKGLGIPNDIADYLASMVPFERGKLWSIKDCLYGNEKKGREPIKQFINEVAKYEGLEEVMLKVQGLINKRSTHAGGVIVLNEHYVEHNALMKSPDGSFITQFNLEDTQALGGIKMDLLSLDALTKIQENVNYLLEDKVIEKEGTLRETFYKYFHPDVIDKESPEIFELASTGTVQDLFQFSTDVGGNAITKATPSNLIEMTAINSIMRLTNRNGITPLDAFSQFKNNIDLWYQEMAKYELTKEEIELMEKHLLHLSGIADTQEVAMLLAMDENIAGFDIAQATMLRKTIAGSSEEKIRKLKELLYNKAKELNVREQLVSYVWDNQITPMLGYAFSSPHVLGYSLIALLQLNLNTVYSPIYWQTAVLNANSGALELDDSAKRQVSNYGKVGTALGELKKEGVTIAPPLINSANYSFTPDVKNSRIIFSLKAIRDVNEETTNEILEKRPFSSFEDFYERIYKNGDGNLKAGGFVNLIKAGAFAEFDDNIEIMKKFILGEISVKQSLNGQNMPSVVRLGLLNEEKYKKYITMFELRKTLNKRVHKKVTQPKDKYLTVKQNEYNTLTELLGNVNIISYLDNKGSVIISQNEMDKLYKKFIQPLYDEFNTPDFLRKFNEAQFLEEWFKRTKGGTIEKWNMDSLIFYPDAHELDNVPLMVYGIEEFDSLEPHPEPIGESVYKGRAYPQYPLYTLAGTVIDKDATKHTVTLLTKTGVVTCKFFGGTFAHYNKEIKLGGKKVEDSWFKRGNLITVSGYRRGDQFVNKKIRGQKHSVSLITQISKGGEISLQIERFGEDSM